MESTIALVVFKGVHCVGRFSISLWGYSNGFLKCSMGLGDVFLGYSMSLGGSQCLFGVFNGFFECSMGLEGF